MPAGTEGELCIAGPGVGRGYVNLPQKTKEKFVKDELGEHMYLAGDLAKLDENGNIVCLGRVDSQVKVRGFRVELEEIETTLLKLPSVRQIAVAMQRDATTGAQVMAAFVVEAEPQARPE